MFKVLTTNIYVLIQLFEQMDQIIYQIRFFFIKQIFKLLI